LACPVRAHPGRLAGKGAASAHASAVLMERMRLPLLYLLESCWPWPPG